MKPLAYYAAARKAASIIQKEKYKGRLPWLSRTWVACVDCGARAIHYEHRDYSKPLEVEPVCQSCNFKRGPARFEEPRKEKAQ